MQELSQPPGARAVLLSVKPQYSDLILSGEKRVEFRRTWAKDSVEMIAIYSSSPIQRIVGLVEVEGFISGSPTKLWSVCADRGGGLTRQELRSYFDGKSTGYGVLLGPVHPLKKSLDPKSIFKDFRAPQSFRYLSVAERKKLEKGI
ncbi:MAG TPA: hypothetical protein DHV21_03540 [Curvibacter sp.]|nr:hypothetical protein [Curvibacter sp.]